MDKPVKRPYETPVLAPSSVFGAEAMTGSCCRGAACTTGTRNACSMIYGALFRAAVALGYCRAVTYTLATEPGSSVKAAGFVEAERLAPRETWNCPGRRRITRNLFGATERPTEAKIRWEKVVPC